MDFRQSSQPSGRTASSSTPANPASLATPANPVAPSEHSSPKKPTVVSENKWFSILNIVVLFGVAILLVGVALVFFNNRQSHSESRYVDTSKYQAVFLNNDQVNSQVQVYFGKIQSINPDYLTLTDVYYLTQNSTSSTTSASPTTSGALTLVKLGCQQIHDPLDQMIISRSQVTFWENLDSSGQVGQKIAEFKKTYPNGPDCSQTTQSTTTPAATTPTTTDTTKK